MGFQTENLLQHGQIPMHQQSQGTHLSLSALSGVVKFSELQSLPRTCASTTSCLHVRAIDKQGAGIRFSGYAFDAVQVSQRIATHAAHTPNTVCGI